MHQFGSEGMVDSFGRSVQRDSLNSRPSSSGLERGRGGSGGRGNTFHEQSGRDYGRGGPRGIIFPLFFVTFA